MKRDCTGFYQKLLIMMIAIKLIYDDKSDMNSCQLKLQ